MNIQQAEFQGFPATHREQASESVAERFLRLSEKNGPLVPQSWIATVLGVSRSRAYQLIGEERFEVCEVGKFHFVAL